MNFNEHFPLGWHTFLLGSYLFECDPQFCHAMALTAKLL